jgi:hypothetical protein
MSHSRDRWYRERRRLDEWRRLSPETKATILEALQGAPQRRAPSQLELRFGQRRL